MGLPNLVFVHLGKSKPRWLVPSYKFSQKILRVQPTFIVDSLALSSQLESQGIRTWIYNQAEDNAPSYVGLDDLAYFRSGFWIHTMRRFWALHAFQQVHNSPLVHLENDVIPLEGFPLGLMNSLPGDIAFPLSAEDYAVASVFYSRNAESLRWLLAKISEAQAANDNSRVHHFQNDMTVLAHMARRHSNRISVLPTLAPTASAIKYTDANLAKNMSSMQPMFGGVFDAATSGQFLFGFDPRNERGLRRVYNSRTYHFLDPAQMRFFSQNHTVTVYQGEGVPGTTLFNLHIHSKDVRALTYERFPALCLKRTRQQRRRTKFEFDKWGFFKSAQGTLDRIMRELKKLSHQQ